MQPSNGLFPLTESDSDSDSKPYRYIVLCRSFSTARTQIGIQIPFLSGYCTHFREESLSQGQISNPITFFQSGDQSLNENLTQWKNPA